MQINPILFITVALIHFLFFFVLDKMENRSFFETAKPLKIVTVNSPPSPQTVTAHKVEANHFYEQLPQTPPSIKTAAPVAKAARPKVSQEVKSKKFNVACNPKSLVKKSPPHQNVIEDLEKSIALLGKETKKTFKKSTVTVPKPITLSVDKDTTAEVSSFYESLLVEELQRRLDLPEFGEVKVKISLSREGKVCEVVVIHSKSILNQTYLKKELANMDLSNIVQYLPKQKNSFTILFKNAI